MDPTATYPYFQGKKILYVHGFASSGSTHTATLLQQKLPQATILHPDLPISPAEMLPFLQQYCAAEKPDLIVGTSMGGALVEKLRGFDRICVNPALHMDQSFGNHLKYGEIAFMNPRQDGVTSFQATKAMAKEFAELSALNFEGLTSEDCRRVTGLFGLEDEWIHHYEEFSSHYPQSAYYDGGHRLNDKAVTYALLPIIQRYWLRQTGKELPVIFADLSLFRRWDDLQQPASRLAIFTLMEQYEVYIVAPLLTAVPYASGRSNAHWLEENLGIAAFDRVVYCDHPERLLGDYYISDRAEVEEQFLGTTLLFGTPQFKTWEALIAFFQQLNGQ